MENGNYRASDMSVSMSDWIRLNFDSYDSATLLRLGEEDHVAYLLLDHEFLSLSERDALDPEDFDTTEEYEAAQSTFEEELSEAEEDYNQRLFPPMWGTVWVGDERTDPSLLSSCGFSVYELPEELGLAGAYVFGVNGAGYSFYGAHWIPLRAALIRARMEDKYTSSEHGLRALRSLAAEADNEGEGQTFRARFLPESGSSE